VAAFAASIDRRKLAFAVGRPATDPAAEMAAMVNDRGSLGGRKKESVSR
jgi:hypothetical protein